MLKDETLDTQRLCAITPFCDILKTDGLRYTSKASKAKTPFHIF